MPYCCEVRPSIDELNQQDWASLAGDDLFMDPRFIRSVEQAQSAIGKFWSVIIRDGSGRPAAIACLSLLSLDLAMLAGGAVKRATATLRQVFPNALSYPAVFCGLPVSAGQSHLRIASNTDVASVLSALVDEMRSIARENAARFLIFKEFAVLDPSLIAALTKQGFFLGESPPMNHFPTAFNDFDDYRAALKAPYRSKIVRSQRKFAEHGLRVECLTDGPSIAARFGEEAFRMYLAVVEKSPVRLEVLSREWFCQMARQFDHESVWTAVYEGDQLLAWAYGLLGEDVYHSLFGGVDYAGNAETDAYFNLMYQELDLALRQRVSDIQLGQTADDFKSRLGATQSKRWFLVLPLRWKARVVLNLASDRVLPKYPAPQERHVFHASRR